MSDQKTKAAAGSGYAGPACSAPPWCSPFADNLPAHELRRALFGLGLKLRDYALTDDEVMRYGGEIIKLSGVCENCRGTGEDGDAPDANGVGGAILPCDSCKGSGIVPQNTTGERICEPSAGSKYAPLDGSARNGGSHDNG